jgi:hypothetical protein
MLYSQTLRENQLEEIHKISSALQILPITLSNGMSFENFSIHWLMVTRS